MTALDILEKKIVALKKLNAAYISALEFDYCPDSNETQSVSETLSTGVSDQDLKSALDANQGRRPDEIAGEISDLIKDL